MKMTAQIIQGDCLDVLRTLESESVQTCVTSPPYYGLRSYKTEPVVWDNHNGCDHVWGDAIKYAKEDKRTPEQKAAQGAVVGNSVNSIGFAVGNSGNFCVECTAWRGELGLEPTFDCQRDRHLDLELRDDLSEQEKETVIRELLALGLIW